ncbi:MAG: SDR family oxidoreductase [Lachnospiraceae bacterium]|nr:SDR family oxidoreductase [Lachnospiraceae bacterium]
MSKYAVITGASSGIGAEFAKQLSGLGYELLLVARRADRLRSLQRELPGPSKIVKADLSARRGCARVMDAIEDLNVEIFINCAGFGDFGKFVETDEEKEFSMVDVNIKAVHYFTKHMLRYFREERQGKGYLLNVASSAGLLPAGPYMATYYATKAYVTSLTRAVSCEMKQEHSPVYVGCLCPGPVNTEFNDVANVSFALPGISPEACVSYAIKKMFQRKTVIVPTLRLRAAVLAGRILPQGVVIPLTARQQRKKGGAD